MVPGSKLIGKFLLMVVEKSVVFPEEYLLIVTICSPQFQLVCLMLAHGGKELKFLPGC